MKKPPLKIKIFNTLLILLFVVFFSLFMANKFGYYEYTNHKKVVFTAEQIKKFEADIKEGKELDLESYIEGINKNYQNPVSRFGLEVTNSLSQLVRISVEAVFQLLNKLVQNG